MTEAVKALEVGPASSLPSASYVSCVSVLSTDTLTPGGKGTHLLHLGGPSQLCSSGSSEAPGLICQMRWSWDAVLDLDAVRTLDAVLDLGCHAGLQIWRRV